MRTSVIIPVHNQLKYTKQIIRSLLGFTPPDELIVVDNGSTDGTSEYLNTLFADAPYSDMDFQVVSFMSNRGFGAAMNAGLKIAKYDCLILLNNDVKVITDDWLEQIRREVQANPKTLFGPQLITNNALTQTDDGNYIPYLSGFVIAFSRGVYKALEVDGEFFDLRFFAYYEDLDITQRALMKGLSIRSLEDLGLYHFGGRTGFSLPNQPDILKASRKAYAEKWGVTWMPMKELGE